MEIELSSPGMKALEARLGRKQGTVGAELSKVLRRSALALQTDARSFAPVRSGDLKRSITVDFSGDGRFGSMSAEIGPTIRYGHCVEHGTSDTAPQPYLGPAADRRVPGLRRAVLDAGGDLL